nr:reverse transcriptase domain-containing protein [Tanacetum cinerariifolium]
MSTNEQTPLSQPTSAVRNTLGKEQAQQNLVRPISEEALREYSDKNYHQILSIIAEKLHQEKAQQEKLKAVKDRLNFEEASRYSESKTSSRRRNLKERLGPRLGDKEKNVSAHSRGTERKSYYSSRRDTESCYQGSRSKKKKLLPRNIATKESIREKRKQCQKVKKVQEGTRSQNQRSKSRVLRMTYPNHSHIKTYDGSEDPEDHLKIFQATAKTERWAMPTCKPLVLSWGRTSRLDSGVRVSIHVCKRILWPEVHCNNIVQAQRPGKHIIRHHK